MFLRSVLLQLTFFLALAAASRLGTAALAGGHPPAGRQAARRPTCVRQLPSSSAAPRPAHRQPIPLGGLTSEHARVCVAPPDAAHSIVSQLWVVVSYGVDGFAAAGIVLGSRLFGLARDPHLRADAKR